MGWEDTFRPFQLAAFQGRELTTEGTVPHLLVDGDAPIAAGWLAAAASLSPNHRFMWHTVRYAARWPGGRAGLLAWFHDQAHGGHQGPEWLSTTYDAFYLESWATVWRLAVRRGDVEMLQAALRWVHASLALYKLHLEADGSGHGRVVAAGCRCGAETDPRREAVFYELTPLATPATLAALVERERWSTFSWDYVWCYAMARQLVDAGEWVPERPTTGHLPRLRHTLRVAVGEDWHESWAADLTGIHGWPQWFARSDRGRIATIRRGGPEGKRGGGGPAPAEPPRRPGKVLSEITLDLGKPVPPLPGEDEVLRRAPRLAAGVDLSGLTPADVFGPERWGWFVDRKGRQLADDLVAWARRQATAGDPAALRLLERLARRKAARAA